MNTRKTEHFIYIVGEQQNGIIPEQQEAFTLARSSMGQIETGELALVIANVFARGQYFPGPDGALTAVIHAFADRADRFREAKTATRKGRCTLITAFKRLDGEMSVKVAAVIPVKSGRLDPEQPEGFHRLLIESLPDFQEVFTEEAYARESKLIGIIQESTLYHINSKLQ